MRVILLTQIGNSIASNPNQGYSDSMRVLSYIRRQGGQTSDIALKEHLGYDGIYLQRIINDLERNQAIRCITSA